MKQQTLNRQTDFIHKPIAGADLLENRRKERYDMHFPSSIELENGVVFRGYTQDLSASGIFFKIDNRAGNVVRAGMRGLGQVTLGSDVYSFQGTVVRSTELGFAIHLGQDQATMGHAITMCIFNELSEKFKI